MAPFLPAAPKKRNKKAQQSESTSLPVTQPTRLGFGEYSHPTLYNKAALYAQLEFVQKIEDLAQEVLVDLAECVRPAYEQLRTEIDESELLSLDAEMLRNRAKHGRNKYGSVQEALEQWIERHYLAADWFRNMALRTLFHWTGKIVVIPGQRLQFTTAISASNPLDPPEQFSFSVDGWAITKDTKKAFVDSVTAEFNFRLAGYVRRVESRAEEAGWTKTPEFRKAEKGSDAFRHFEWLVRWQCQRWTTTEIARKYRLGNPRKTKSAKQSAKIPDSANRESDRNTYAEQSTRRRKAAYRTVHDGLKKAAELVGLPLRPGNLADKNNLSQ